MFSKLLCALLLLGSTSARASLEAALAAEANWNSAIALELFLAADRAKPDDPYILQKIAQQYADLIADQLTNDTRQDFAQAALAYAQRATALDANAINVLSVAVAYGSSPLTVILPKDSVLALGAVRGGASAPLRPRLCLGPSCTRALALRNSLPWYLRSIARTLMVRGPTRSLV